MRSVKTRSDVARPGATASGLLFAAWAVVAPAVALLAAAAPIDAQGRAAPGWVGISFEVRRGVGAGRAATVIVTDVRDASPAAEAGLRAGDVLLAINDVRGPDELGSVIGRLQLRAGDPVRIQVERDGWQREIRLRAAARPYDATVSSTLTLSFEPDSVVETMVRAMDSLRDRLARSGGVRVRVPEGAGGDEIRVLASGHEGGAHVLQAPFEFFVFRGEAHDSLRSEMEALNRRIADLNAREEGRLQELRRTSDALNRARLLETDEELAELRAARQEAARRSALLRASMAEAARVSAGLAYSRSPEVAVTPRAASAYREEFRPLTPYLLGRNRVAGAEVVDLRPELAQYFGVEGGILVVDVPDLTPAGMAGLRPGDVVTRLGREPVRSVEELRLAVSSAGRTVPLTLIRQGASIEVLLRR
jgi:membrane-associated protease RseP (regulator of RpoE activity)